MRFEGARNALAFAAAFAATALALAELRPLPDPNHLRAKFEHWREHGDDYDAVVIGSSRVLRGFDPDVFDARTAQLGAPTHSYNFGVPGMRGHEADRVLRDLLALRPARLKHVLVEFPDYTATFPDEKWANSERALWWHDARHTRDALRSAWLADETARERFMLGLQHVRLFVANSLNYGGVESACDRWFLDHPNEAKTTAEILARRGFAPIADDRRPTNPTELKYSERGSAIVEESVPRIARQNERTDLLPHYNSAALLDEADAIATARLVPVFFTVPCAEPNPIAHSFGADRLMPRILSIGDPVPFGRLYRTPLFSDGAHLKESGAREFSRALATEYFAPGS